MVAAIQNGTTSQYQSTQNLTASSGFQQQTSQIELKQKASQTQGTQQQSSTNLDDASRGVQRSADNDFAAAPSEGRGSVLDISV